MDARRSKARSRLCTAAAALSLGLIPAAGLAQDRRPPPCFSTYPSLGPAERESRLQSLTVEEVAITGFVRDEAGAPVANVVVTVDDTYMGTMTAADGGYLLRFLNLQKGIRRPGPMVRACSPYFEWLTEVREIQTITPNGDVVVLDVNGVAHPNPGYAVRLDFVVRRRRSVL